MILVILVFLVMANLQPFHSYLADAGLDTKPHQVEGVEWCLQNEVEGHVIGDASGDASGANVVRGGLIADEMGLGKTMQMIGVMLCNFKRHTLIVLPRALLEQWENVFRATTGHRVLVYHGAGKKGVSVSMLRAAPIVITTYGMVATRKTGLSMLHRVKWNRVVFDEAHHIRNSNTRVHKGALKLRAKIRWLVTGTPIQNTKNDFYSMCAAMGLPNGYYLVPTNIPDVVRRFILKRTKSEIGLALPPLQCVTTKVDWSDDVERRLAESVHSLLSFSGVVEGGEKCFNLGLVNGICGEFPLVALLRARQMCVYPPMLRRKIKDLVDMGALEDDPALYDGARSSSKIDSVVETILGRKDNGRSKLVFCHYRGEIDALKSRLIAGGLSHVETFDGRTLTSERNRIITQRCDALILQIQTGCEGLNLQHFSEVYFVSPHWNPAVEDQAVARCHRIGQEQPVDVFRFEMSGFDSCEGVEGVEGDEDNTISIDSYAKHVQESKRDLREMLEQNGDGEEDGHGEDAGHGEDDDCPVCMEKIVDRETLGCGHGFCQGCVQEIRSRNMLQACPICRAPF